MLMRNLPKAEKANYDDMMTIGTVEMLFLGIHKNHPTLFLRIARRFRHYKLARTFVTCVTAYQISWQNWLLDSCQEQRSQNDDFEQP